MPTLRSLTAYRQPSLRTAIGCSVICEKPSRRGISRSVRQERYPIESITDVALEAIVSRIEVKERGVEIGRPRHYSDSNLLRFHVYRFGKGGWSVRRMLREMRRDHGLLKVLAMPSVPSVSTVSERSKYLPWQALWHNEGKRRLLALDASALPSVVSDPDGA